MTIKIEKNIPFPDSRFPFSQMQVGDSFAVPMDVSRQSVAVAALRYARKHNVKFTTRMTPAGLRCWRIE